MNYSLIEKKIEMVLRGRVQIPTGGKARERLSMNRCDSGADSEQSVTAQSG